MVYKTLRWVLLFVIYSIFEQLNNVKSADMVDGARPLVHKGPTKEEQIADFLKDLND
nr:venom polypeptide precursor [Doratifera vulnerans]